MSNSGQSPTLSRVRLTPRSADPANPREGDIQYSDGTARDEGVWVYTDGAWAQFSTGAAISVLPSLTLTPASSDPGTPAEGMLFVADGTSRAEGLWQYMNGDWVQITGLKWQEFYHKDVVDVRVASTANITLASAVENGDTLDGVTLATGDLILLKNQTTATENGVYVVAISGAPTRHSSADTFSELNDYAAWVSEGTVNKGTIWYQTATLTSLATNQVWSTTPQTYSFVVPEGVYEVEALIAGGGGGGGSGGGSNAGGGGGNEGASGGSGGAGSQPILCTLKTTPGETLTITAGAHGLPGFAVSSSPGDDGGDGGSSIVAGSLQTITVLGGAGGIGGLETTGGNVNLAGGAAISTSWAPRLQTIGSGAGGNGSNSGGTGETAGSAGQASLIAAGGAGGSVATTGGGGGGGGGAGVEAGGAGSNGNNTSGSSPIAKASDGGLSAGGGGGGGCGHNGLSARRGGHGGSGGSGYVRISW